jgi:hypothetical protein
MGVSIEAARVTITLVLKDRRAQAQVAKINKALGGTKKAGAAAASGMRAASKGAKKTARSFNLLKSAMPFAGVASLILGFKKIITVTAEQQRVESQLNAVLKSTGNAAGLTAEQIKKQAAAFQEVTTFGDEAIIQGQNLLLTFTKIGKDVFPQATETVLNMAAAMGTDLKTQAIQVGKALQDPILGVTALRRVGVQLSESQTAQIKNFVKLGDVAGAQKVILGELETQFGGVARAASQTLGGALQQLGNSFGDAFEDVGNEFTPALVELAQALKDSLKDGGGLSEVLKVIGKAIGKIIQVIAVVVRGFNLLQAVTDGSKDSLKIIGEESKRFGVISTQVGHLVGKSSLGLIDLREAAEKARRGMGEYSVATVQAAQKAESRIKSSTGNMSEALEKFTSSVTNLAGIQNTEDEQDATRKNAQLQRIKKIAGAQKQSAKAAKEAAEAATKAAATRKAALDLLAKSGDQTAFLEKQRTAFAEQVSTVRQAGLDVTALERFQQQQRVSQYSKFFAQVTADQNATFSGRQAGLNEQLQTVLDSENLSYEERLAAQTAFNEQSMLLEQQRFQAIAATTQQIAQVGQGFIAIAQNLSTVRQNQIKEEISALEEQGASEEEIEKKRKQLARKAAVDQQRFSIFAAILDTSVAITKALASTPPPASYALAALSAVKGATQVAAIRSTPIPKAQFGGTFSVPPGNEADTGLLNVSSGETVKVEPSREANSGGGFGGNNGPITLMIGDRPFEAFMVDTMNSLLNSGKIQITKKGVLKAS